MTLRKAHDKDLQGLISLVYMMNLNMLRKLICKTPLSKFNNSNLDGKLWSIILIEILFTWQRNTSQLQTMYKLQSTSYMLHLSFTTIQCALSNCQYWIRCWWFHIKLKRVAVHPMCWWYFVFQQIKYGTHNKVSYSLCYTNPIGLAFF